MEKKIIGSIHTYKSGGTFWDKESNTFKSQSVIEPVTLEYDYYEYKVDRSMELYDILIENSKNNSMSYWLDSRCTWPDDEYVIYIVRSVEDKEVRGADLFYDWLGYEPDEQEYAWGVRPIVTLNSSVHIDKTDTSKNGSSAQNAWNLK